MLASKLYLHPVLIFYIFPLLCGAILNFALPPFGFWPSLVLGFGLFLHILIKFPARSEWQKFARGWCFGFGYFLFGLSWIGNALLVDGNDYVWAWPLAVIGLPFALAFFTGAAIYIFEEIPASKGSATSLLAFVLCLSLSEFLRGHLFTGFPWNLYGYGFHAIEPLTQITAVIGIYGLTMATVFWCSVPVWFLYAGKTASRWVILLIAVISITGALYYGHNRLSNVSNAVSQSGNDQPTLIRIVQPNIPQSEKWIPEKQLENLNKVVRLSKQISGKPEINLIIWPETAISDYALQHSAVRDKIYELFDGHPDTLLATGHLRVDKQTEDTLYYNSLTVFDKDFQALYAYDKSHLVPFGEYIPFQDYIPLGPISGFEGFVSGQKGQNFSIPGQSISINSLICYEIIFPEGAVSFAEQRPDLLINITNDGWYGDSAGPYQHFVKTRFRAIEQGIYIARAANTGISGLINPYGKVIGSLPLNTPGFLDLPIYKNSISATVYSRLHDTPLIIFFLISGLWIAGICLYARK